ncbi:MAG: hypothetical protein ACI9LU_001206 [Polaribacter sp.]|jgi:hypothetical protein
MRRTEWLQEHRLLQLEKAYEGWTQKRITQIDSTCLLNVWPRTFQRYIGRYEDEGM